MRKKLALIATSSLILASGMMYLLTADARGLKTYLNAFLTPHNIQLTALSCEMNGRTRAGHCTFYTANDEFSRIKSALHLELIPDKQLEGGFPGHGCSTLGWDPHKDETIMVYHAVPALKPMSGNDRSSFIRLWYKPVTGEACVDMEYPYG